MGELDSAAAIVLAVVAVVADAAVVEGTLPAAVTEPDAHRVKNSCSSSSSDVPSDNPKRTIYVWGTFKIVRPLLALKE